MFITNTIILSLIVSLDSFLLCLTNKNTIKKHYFLTPFIFSIFQAIFLLIGYLIGDFIEIYLSNYIKYIVFLIFSSMGLKLIVDTLLKKGKEETISLSLHHIILQAIATSCDSLFLGLPFAFNDNNYLILSPIVSIITFIMCFLGLLLKNKINDILEDQIGLIGAFLLFVFAFKSLL